MRWRMCRKCHVKLIVTNEDIKGECVIEKCPICKSYYLTIFPNTSLLSRLRKIAKETSKTVEEVINESFKNLKSIVRNN